MPEYTGWDDYLNEKEQERHKAENPLLEARLSVIENHIENIDRHLNPVLDRIRVIIEILEYNQIGLPLAHGKRFVPSISDRDILSLINEARQIKAWQANPHGCYP